MGLSKFFTVELFPQFTAAGLIQTDKNHLPFSEGDVIIDWEPFNIPNCPVLLRDINVVVRGKDGSPQTNRDLVFYFARPNTDGTAPSSLGTVNATASGGGYFNNLVGTVILDEADFKPGLDYISMASTGQASTANQQPDMVLESIAASSRTTDTRSTTVGFDAMYLGMIAGLNNTMSFETGVQVNDGDGVSVSTTQVDITVDGTDARKVFAKGDLVGAMDGAAIGTVHSVPDGTSLIVDTVDGALADDDEIVNLTPFKIILSFEY
tara:strand:+ start:1382 stop:2176 length:795 start_codon:yes stop_codon:yes gene_type:complete